MLGGTGDELAERMTCDELFEWREFLTMRREQIEEARRSGPERRTPSPRKK